MKAGAFLRRALIFVAFAAGTAPAAEPTYQLKGKIVQPDGKSFGRWSVIFLSSATTPFATRAIGDVSGSFGFRDLSAGTYNLTVAIPRVGEFTRTIEVSPNFADKKRVVRTTIVVDRSFVSAKPMHRVSAAALAIPDRANREYNRAMECLERKDVEGAIDRLQRALKIAPRFPAALNSLGTISYQRKEFREAEEYFRNALQIDPEAYEPLVNLAGTMLSLQRCGDALAWNLRAVNARPNDPLAQSQLGRNYFCLAQYEHAEEHLKQAKALDASHFSFPQLVLARVYREIKNWAAAVNELEEFLKLHPDSNLAAYAQQDLADIRTHLP